MKLERYRYEAIGVSNREWVAAQRWLTHRLRREWEQGKAPDVTAVAMDIQSKFPDHVALALTLDLSETIRLKAVVESELIGRVKILFQEGVDICPSLLDLEKTCEGDLVPTN